MIFIFSNFSDTLHAQRLTGSVLLIKLIFKSDAAKYPVALRYYNYYSIGEGKIAEENPWVKGRTAALARNYPNWYLSYLQLFFSPFTFFF